MKKPAIQGTYPQSSADISAVKANVEIITAKRPGVPKLDIAGLESMVISNPPTQAQVDKLRLELAKLARRLDE